MASDRDGADTNFIGDFYIPVSRLWIGLSGRCSRTQQLSSQDIDQLNSFRNPIPEKISTDVSLYGGGGQPAANGGLVDSAQIFSGIPAVGMKHGLSQMRLGQLFCLGLTCTLSMVIRQPL